jgi:acyl-CoA thioesterase
MNDNAVQRFLANDRFASSSGIRLLEVSDGFALASMKITQQHFNGAGIVQGGAIFTLADLAFAAAVNSHGTVAVAVNISITFMKAAKAGTLNAEAKEIAMNPKLASCTVRVIDDAGDLVAIFQGLAYRKKESVAECNS